MDTFDLLTEMDRLIERRSLLETPFYRRWVAGTLPREALGAYACQYFAFESTFPRVLSALHSRCERADLRAILLDNLWDEEHGEENHAELWLRFAEGVGASRDEVRTAPWTPSTERLVETYRVVAAEAPIAAGVAAVHAYEAQVPAVAQAKIDGLRRHYGVDDPSTLRFFDVHRVLDQGHAEGERRIVRELGHQDPDAVLDATEQALAAWWAFLEDLEPAA